MNKFIYDSNGLLQNGTYVVSEFEFINEFCRHSEDGRFADNKRAMFARPISQLCSWSKANGATSIIIGGSFVSDKCDPSDIDVLILFKTSQQVPKSVEKVYADGVILDINLISEEQELMKSAFMELLATDRRGIEHGIVQIKMHDSVTTQEKSPTKSPIFETVLNAYTNRHQLRLQSVKGVVIPIHGINTDAPWMPNLSFLLSSSGWAVAPFMYGNEPLMTLLKEKRRSELVQGLREWLEYIASKFDGPISIIAHSLGTYLIGKYLTEASFLSKRFDSIILSGSILSQDFDWQKYFGENYVGMVLNTISTTDEYTKYIPNGGLPLIADDPIYGCAGSKGFSKKHKYLREEESSLLKHANVIENDVIRTLWLPFLEYARIVVDRRSTLEKSPRNP